MRGAKLPRLFSEPAFGTTRVVMVAAVGQVQRRVRETNGLLPRLEAGHAARFFLVREVGIPADAQVQRQPLIDAPVVLIESPPPRAGQLLEFAAALLEIQRRGRA